MDSVLSEHTARPGPFEQPFNSIEWILDKEVALKVIKELESFNSIEWIQEPPDILSLRVFTFFQFH